MSVPLRTYHFDVDARIEYECEASCKEEAEEYFAHMVEQAGADWGIGITPDSYGAIESKKEEK